MFINALFGTYTLWLSLCVLPLVAGAATWQTSPFSPPAWPLAVKSPYVSAWLKGGQDGGYLASSTYFAEGAAKLGWTGYVRVDNTTYTFLGDSALSSSKQAVQKSANFTATQSIFVLQAGAMDVTATFLSPIEGSDLVRQSLPFSYLTISVQSNDGKQHNVQVYTDITGEWLGSDDTLGITWATNVEQQLLVHSANLTTQFQNELNGRAYWGTAYHATLISGNTTYQTGPDQDTRQRFITTGRLGNSQDTNFRPIGQNKPVFAFAHDLGNVATSEQPVITMVGHDRDPVVLYNSGLSPQPRRSYWRTMYTDVTDAITFFLQDYDRAKQSADAFDVKVHRDAAKISEDYAGIVALSARQAFAGVEITVGTDASGSLNPNDVMAFMKGSPAGSLIQSVEILYASFPAFFYASPKIASALLEPFLQRELNGANPLDYSPHDLGVYPNATGNIGRDAPIEETANMVIMAIAAFRATGSGDQLIKYWSTFVKYARYLQANALYAPDAQLSAEDYNGPIKDQSNLALKGIIAIYSISATARTLGKDISGEEFSRVGTSYIDQWIYWARTTDQTHMTWQFHNITTYVMLYNGFADVLGGAGILDSSAATITIIPPQDKFYPTAFQQYGLPIDSLSPITRSDFSLFTAATAKDKTTRDLFISKYMMFIAGQTATGPLANTYDATTGQSKNTSVSVAVGGHFALLVNGSQAASAGTTQQSAGTPLPSIFVPYVVITTITLLGLSVLF